MADKQHIFGIGLPKTCLTSLLNFMRDNGFDAEGRNAEVFRQFRRGQYDKVLDYYDTREYMCGFPAQFMYKQLFAKYGKDAKYILTHRKDGATWYRSICRHNRYAHPIRNKHKWIFGRFYPHGFEDEHVAYYDRYMEDVLDFFKQNNAMDCLLTIDCTQPGAVEKLEDFLEIRAVSPEFPHKNKGDEMRDGGSNSFKYQYNKVAQYLYQKIAPRLFRKPGPVPLPLEPDFGRQSSVT